MTQEDRLLERIQKLMALADPNANDNQAQVEAAAMKAAELMVKYNLTPKDVSVHEVKSQLTRKCSAFFWGDKADGALVAGFNSWFVRLAGDVEYANYCEVLHTPHSAVFIGKERDAEIAEFMFNNLAFRLIVLSKAEVKKYEREYHAKYGDTAYKSYGKHHPKVWRRTWLEGAVAGLSEKLRQPRRDKETAQYMKANKNALIVVNSALQAYLDEHYPNLKKAKGFEAKSANGGWDTYKSGEDAGRKLSLQQGMTAGESKQMKELSDGRR